MGLQYVILRFTATINPNTGDKVRVVGLGFVQSGFEGLIGQRFHRLSGTDSCINHYL